MHRAVWQPVQNVAGMGETVDTEGRATMREERIRARSKSAGPFCASSTQRIADMRFAGEGLGSIEKGARCPCGASPPLLIPREHTRRSHGSVCVSAWPKQCAQGSPPPMYRTAQSTTEAPPTLAGHRHTSSLTPCKIPRLAQPRDVRPRVRLLRAIHCRPLCTRSSSRLARGHTASRDVGVAKSEGAPGVCSVDTSDRRSHECADKHRDPTEQARRPREQGSLPETEKRLLVPC
ncbi:hypothetical protein DFH06DRAFT_176566 [Mycena polygramma]|nr:hypothetical protein DFH06DRAFT_176566 [Mycena polygramma]